MGDVIVPRALLAFVVASILNVAHAQADTKPGPARQPAVTVLGLGNMGSALARTFVARGDTVTVWNRTAAKAEPLVAAGAKAAATPAAAIAASPLTVICTLDKGTTAGVLQGPGAAAAMRGRTIVDLSTGTPTQARANAALVTAAGGRYIDGGIMGYPRDIGSADGLILYSGDRAAFTEHEATLAQLAGAQRYLGEDQAAAATAYFALWTYYFPAISSFFEGAALAQTADIPLAEYRELAGIMTGKLGAGFDDALDRIGKRNYAGDQAPVDIYLPGLYLIRDTYTANRLGHAALDAFIDELEQAQRMGHGGKDIAILFKVVGGRDDAKAARDADAGGR